MNVETIAPPIITGLLSVGTISVFVAKYVTKVAKYTHIASVALKLADDAVIALQDGKVNQDEIDRIVDDVAKLKESFK